MGKIVTVERKKIAKLYGDEKSLLGLIVRILH